MIVPRFWSEARRRHRSRSRQVTVRRWGWSDESQGDADRMAAARAEEALERALADPRTLRREPRVPYNGAEGVPIREEIVGRHGSAVVTRNSYGARCLNTPDVLFADVDLQVAPGCGASVVAFLAISSLLALGSSLLPEMETTGVRVLVAAASIVAAIVLAGPVARALFHLLYGGPDRIAKAAIARVRAFVDRHPRWNVRVYRTPSGLRLLATQATLDPRSKQVEEFFRAVRVDPIYQRMCVRQNCFRARLTAKPWRCGVASHIKPRPGVWPVQAERLPERNAWVEAYEKRASEFAACAYVESIGSGIVHPAVASIVTFHDDQCRALVPGLPIA